MRAVAEDIWTGLVQGILAFGQTRLADLVGASFHDTKSFVTALAADKSLTPDVKQKFEQLKNDVTAVADKVKPLIDKVKPKAEDAVKQVQQIIERGKAWDYQPDREMLTRTLALLLNKLVEEFKPENDWSQVAPQVGRLLDVAALLNIPLDLWYAQNRLLDTTAAMVAKGALIGPERDAVGVLADRFRIHRQLLGWEP